MFSAEEEAGSEDADAEMDPADQFAGVGPDGKPLKPKKTKKVASKSVGKLIVPTAGQPYPARKPAAPKITAGRFEALAEDQVPQADPGDG